MKLPAILRSLSATIVHSASALTRIRDDIRGSIGRYLRMFAAIRDRAERVIIDGSCLNTTALSSGASVLASVVLPAPGNPMMRILRISISFLVVTSTAACPDQNYPLVRRARACRDDGPCAHRHSFLADVVIDRMKWTERQVCKAAGQTRQCCNHPALVSEKILAPPPDPD
jgi:hypothetical protein